MIMTRRLEPGLDPCMTDVDKLTFLSDAKIEPFNDDAIPGTSLSIGRRCMLELGRITGSLEKKHVLIGKRVSMSKRVWDSDLYTHNTLIFPLQNVPIKCNIILKVVELLKSYDLFDNSFYGVFSYLARILDASNMERPRTNPSDTVSETNTTLETMNKMNRYFKGLSIDSRRFDNASGSSKQYRPSLLPWKSIKSLPDLHTAETYMQKENYTNFPRYKQLVVTLYEQLGHWDPDCSLNDPLFAFVYGTIYHFILQDCKALLVDYIDRRLFS